MVEGNRGNSLSSDNNSSVNTTSDYDNTLRRDDSFQKNSYNNTNAMLLGVAINGSISQKYAETLYQRYENADSLAKKVFDTYKNELSIQNSNYPENQTAHYLPEGFPGHSRGVYYNSSSDENNPKGNGTTFFHELGHMIDHASTGFSNNTSNTIEFREALMSDGQHVLDLYKQLSKDRKEDFLRRIYQGDAHSFSDLIDATTNGVLCGAYGHTKEYWRRDGNLQAEAFAHFFEASMGCHEKMKFLSDLFPHAFGVFCGMLENIVSKPKVLVLRRR